MDTDTEKEGMAGVLKEKSLKYNQLLVVNRIGTLRRVTVKTLKNITDLPIIESNDFNNVYDTVEGQSSPIIIILELSDTPSIVNEAYLIKKIKSHPISRQYPVIVTAQNPDKEVVLHCLKSGADHFLIKPLNINEYSQKIRETITQYIY